MSYVSKQQARMARTLAYVEFFQAGFPRLELWLGVAVT